MFDFSSPAPASEKTPESDPDKVAALPLEARVEQGAMGRPGARGWTIRVPVRAERVTIEKRSVVREEARVGRVARDGAVVRRKAVVDRDGPGIENTSADSSPLHV